MFTLDVKNRAGETVGTVTLEKELLGEKVKLQLMHEACLMYEANLRQGNASAKTRAEVSGSRSKPFRQKGTGRARVGTIQSPIRKGGGVAHGPRPRDFSYDIGRKARRAALKSALLSKFQDDEVLVLEELVCEEPRTRDVVEVLKNLGLEKSLLVVLKPHPAGDGSDELKATRNLNVVKSVRNIPGVTVMNVTDLNTYEVLKNNKLLFTQEAFDKLRETLSC